MPPPALIIQPGELIITAFQQRLTIIEYSEISVLVFEKFKLGWNSKEDANLNYK